MSGLLWILSHEGIVGHFGGWFAKDAAKLSLLLCQNQQCHRFLSNPSPQLFIWHYVLPLNELDATQAAVVESQRTTKASTNRSNVSQKDRLHIYTKISLFCLGWDAMSSMWVWAPTDMPFHYLHISWSLPRLCWQYCAIQGRYLE